MILEHPDLKKFPGGACPQTPPSRSGTICHGRTGFYPCATALTREARAAAALAEEKKAKYLDLAQTHHFVAVVVETAGAMGTDALDFFVDIGS